MSLSLRLQVNMILPLMCKPVSEVPVCIESQYSLWPSQWAAATVERTVTQTWTTEMTQAKMNLFYRFIFNPGHI